MRFPPAINIPKLGTADQIAFLTCLLYSSSIKALSTLSILKKVITSNICFIINNKGSSLGIASKLRLFNIASYSCSNTIRSS